MAKLSPPVVSGTIPPCYKDIRKGTVALTVPFMMNKVVSIAEVTAIGIRIKDGTTDQVYGELKETNWHKDIGDPYVTFNLGSPDIKSNLASKLIVGNYYKIQLAYYDLYGKIGYYSTISIVKYTTQPTVTLIGFNRYITNVDMTHYVGSYININDPTEKAYQYKFTLYNSTGEVLESSGWLTHNVNTDTEMGKSQDEYDLMYSIQANEKYAIQYSVLTNNSLQCNSPKYQLVGTTSVKPELDATLLAELNYDSGTIELRLRENKMPVIDPVTKQRQIPQLSGAFILVRSSSVENFTIWTKLYNFYLTGKLPDDVIFKDYTVEHGQTYRYAIQQYNAQNIYSDKMYAIKCIRDDDNRLVETKETDILAHYEDMFLFDGDRQLKVRFNPKVASFKTVFQETKKNTLGSRYPFFFRNGATEYKEFPVAGLISYLGDDREDFMLRQEELLMPIDWQDTTDITDDNLLFERRFKMAVLNWLNNGHVKLFRSPSEGNFLVRLMNVSLTPEVSISRMIHNFNATAIEVDDYTPSKLSTYGFLQADPKMPTQLRFGTVSLDELIEQQILKATSKTVGTIPTIEEVLADLSDNYDLLKGLGCQYIKIEDCWPNTEFELGGESFYVGATGSYEAHFTNNPYGLYIKNPRRHMNGIVHYGVLTTQSNTFDTVNGLSQYDMFDVVDVSPTNYIAEHTSIKKQINKIYFMNFYINDLIYEFESIEHFQQHYHLLMDSEHEEQYRVYLSGRIQSETGVFTKEQIEEMNETRKYGTWSGEEGNSTFTFNFSDFMAQYYQIQHSGGSYQFDYVARGAQDLYINNTLIRTTSDNRIWRYQIGTYSSPNGGYYGMYATITPISYTNLAIKPTCVYIDDEVIDLSITGAATLPMTETIPENIHWGSAVTMCACYQILDVTYGEEYNTHYDLDKPMSLDDMRRLVNECYKLYCAREIDLIPYRPVNLKQIINSSPIDDEIAYFTWIDDRFYRMAYEDKVDYTGSEDIWICNTGISKRKVNGEMQYYYDENKRQNYGYVSTELIGGRDTAVNPSADGYASWNRTYLELLGQELAAKEKELRLSEN